MAAANGGVSRNRIVFGTDQVEAPAKALRAGALTADLSDGALRRICWHGREVLRGINLPIRDDSWRTFLPESVKETLDASSVGFRYERTFTVGDGKLACRLTYVGSADGTLSAEVTMTPKVAFHTNRAGFTVLHPLENFAGETVRVTHSGDAAAEEIAIPALISPSQPVFDIVGMDFAVAGAQASLRFGGEVFEMEDQRNWTDASFKTYCRPLSQPWPYELPAGEPVTQTITLSLSGTPAAEGEAGSAEGVRFAPGEGTFPEVALALEEGWSGGRAGTAAALALQALPVRGLQVRVLQDRTAPLVEALALAKTLGAGIDLEIILSDEAGAAEEELAKIAAVLAAEGVAPRHVIALPAAFLKSYQPDADWPQGLQPARAAELARAAFPRAWIGLGMLSNFTELNRHPPRGAHAEFVTHSATPIVHAGDDRSVLETLEALPHVFRSTATLAKGRVYRLGLVAIGMRSNPYGAAVADNPAGLRMAMAQSDPRHGALFGAAWAVGVLAGTEGSPVEALALGAPAGPFGVTKGDGLTALFHVIRAAAAMSGKPRLAVTGLPQHVVACAAGARGTPQAIIANLGAEPVQLTLLGTVRVLDTGSAAAAARTAHWLDVAAAASGVVTLEPFAVAFVS